MTLRRLLGIRLFTAIAALVPAAAAAHAVIVASSPRVNAQIAQGRLEIRLQFNSRIDAHRSRVTLLGPDGAEHPVVLAHDTPPGALLAHADVGTPGPWRLRWQVLSVDGHITRGEIPFTVRDRGS